MIGLVHDSHVRESLCKIGILAQTVGGRRREVLETLEVSPVGDPKGGDAFAVRKIKQGSGPPEICEDVRSRSENSRRHRLSQGRLRDEEEKKRY